MARVSNGSAEFRDLLERFIYNLMTYEEPYYTRSDVLAHVSQLTHPCPLYNYKQFMKKKETGSEVTVYYRQPMVFWIGSIMHKGLEHFVSNEFIKCIDSEKRIKQIDKEIVFTYNILQDRPALPSDPAHELICGRVDLLITMEDGTQYIIDYKTTRNIHNSAFQQQYLNQLTLYSYCLNRSGYKVTQCALLYINMNMQDIHDVSDMFRYVIVDISQENATVLLKYVKEFFEAVRDNKEPAGRLGTWCVKCPFREECAKMKELKRDENKKI